MSALFLVALCASTFAAAPAGPARSSPVRKATTEEAARVRKAVHLADTDLSGNVFRVGFAPYEAGAFVIDAVSLPPTPDALPTLQLALVTADGAVTQWAYATDGGDTWGEAAVTFVDLDGNGTTDVLATSPLCMGANCVQNAWNQPLVLLNDGARLRPARAWVEAMPQATQNGTLAALRAWAKTHRPKADPAP